MNPDIILYIIAALLILELALWILVNQVRSMFQWLITSKDEVPVLDKAGLVKFIKSGYDPELGWIRKPNTSNQEIGKYGGTTYNIGPDGSRQNPINNSSDPEIACFGDSFTFCRQVNDDETWEYFISKISGLSVSNYGVGNYGLDQAYLRLKRESSGINPKIILMGVVPSTIMRILCVWKHYNEFGNTFGFKPRFDLVGGELQLIDNFIDEETKFDSYVNYLPEIQKSDFFYKSKFRKEIIRSPYLFHTLKNAARNFKIIFFVLLNKVLKFLGKGNKYVADYPLQEIMRINLDLRVNLFNSEYAVNILDGILDKFMQQSNEMNAKPVFVFLPQKDDVLYIKDKGNYYERFVNMVSKKILTIDLTDKLLEEGDIDFLYSDDGVYGGHFSKDGNQLVGEYIYTQLKDKKYL